MDASLKVCLYRFAQEGLNNAFRHAGGRGQALSARCDGDLLEVVVTDDGPDSGDRGQAAATEGLELAELADRSNPWAVNLISSLGTAKARG